MSARGVHVFKGLDCGAAYRLNEISAGHLGS
jgi:hypothetical protein